MPANYPLRGRMDLVRRRRGSELLGSLARSLAEAEQRGTTLESVNIYFSEGEYVGLMFTTGEVCGDVQALPTEAA